MGRPKGRPAKERPQASKENIRAVKQMVRRKDKYSGYEAAKAICTAYPKIRPTMMRKLKLNTEGYEETGRIEYDRDLASRIHIDDRRYIENYEQSMNTAWILEHGVASIADDRTRAIAEDTILRGRRVETLTGKYGIGAHAIWMRKKEAIEWIA